MPLLTYIFIGGIGIPAIVYGVLYEQEVLLFVAAAYIPFNLLLPADFGGIQKALNGTNLVLAALFLGMVFGRKSQTVVKKTDIALKLVGLYIALSLISYARGSLFHGLPYFQVFIFPLKRWLTPIFLFSFFYKMIRDRNTVKIIFGIVMITVIGNIFFGVLEWVDLGFATYAGSRRRLGGFNMHPNFFGAFIAYYLCLLLGPFLTGFNKTSAKFLLFPLLIGLRVIIPTNSRGAWIAFPPALATLIFFKSKILFIGFFCGILILIVFFPFLVPETVRTRFEAGMALNASHQIFEPPSSLPQQFLSSSSSISFRARAVLLEGGLKIIARNPWFGVGWGVFPYIIGNYTEGGLRGSAHNMFLRIGVEMGLITIVAFFALLFFLFKAALYVFRREEDTMLKGITLGYMGSIPAIIVCNLTGNRFDAVDLISIFWILSGCILYLKKAIQAERMGLI